MEAAMLSIEEVENFVQPDYAVKDVMHNFSHIRRVRRLAEEIAKNHDHDPSILMLAIYFHGNIYRREAEIRAFLESKQLPREVVERVIQAAWESGTSAKPETVEGAILHDAHLLEGGKTFHIAKPLVTGTARGQTLEETLRFIEEHILGKWQCCLPESQDRYQEKERFAREFLADLKENL
jgi:uncharacterized protein